MLKGGSFRRDGLRLTRTCYPAQRGVVCVRSKTMETVHKPVRETEAACRHPHYSGAMALSGTGRLGEAACRPSRRLRAGLVRHEVSAGLGWGSGPGRYRSGLVSEAGGGPLPFTPLFAPDIGSRNLDGGALWLSALALTGAQLRMTSGACLAAGLEPRSSVVQEDCRFGLLRLAYTAAIGLMVLDAGLTLGPDTPSPSPGLDVM
ncbi:hypothetical protein NDU88_000500 [Pleurodeles waltl]|uniref:Uncharacterized protein n=1 Tax=Pleurodeles waltl TaxID=8319 RepID=A0AAV7NCD4_PLEWA|nr:hypothetical protein NDU88_000500 [Pleurodeles waltl]